MLNVCCNVKKIRYNEIAILGGKKDKSHIRRILHLEIIFKLAPIAVWAARRHTAPYATGVLTSHPGSRTLTDPSPLSFSTWLPVRSELSYHNKG